MPTYSIDGVTGPTGSPTQAGAPNLGELPAVSQSTPASLASDVDSNGWEHAWWKITPSESGARMVDGSLSYDSDGDPLPSYVDVFTLNLDGVTFDFFDGVSNFGPITFAAGVDYYLSVGRSFGFGDGSSQMVLRVGTTVAPTDWVQPDEQAWVVSQDSGVPGTALHDSSVIPSGADINNKLSTDHGYQGSYEESQAFGGPRPIDDGTAGVDCAWPHAARGENGGQWWSEDPLNPDIDIHAQWFGGPATCVALNTDPATWLGTAGTVGATLTSGDGSDGHGNLTITTSGLTQRYWLTAALTALGRLGGLLPPTPPPGGSVEYESPAPSLLAVDASPDQTTHLESGVDVTVQWYGTGVDLVENPGDAWGPQREWVDPGGGGVVQGRFIGAASGPSGFASTQDLQLPDFPPGVTTAPAWQTVDPAVVAHALATEAEWQAQWDAGTDRDLISNFAGALRFVALFPDMLTSTEPPALTAAEGVPGSLDVEDVRHGQFVALRLHVLPTRYRIFPSPTLPDVDSASYARLLPRDDEYGITPSPRLWPPAKSNRLAGNIP